MTICHEARGGAVLALIAFAVGLTGCASLPGRARIETPHGWHDGAVGGTGSPVVVFEAGAGDGLEVWEQVFPEVVKFSTALAYSRRGYGVSMPRMGARTGEEVVRELRELLASQGLRPPYVLVGHSLGGLYMELFAKLHPTEVAGLVLVDPTHPDHLERLRRDRPGAYAIVEAMQVTNLGSTLGAELRGAAETGRQWHAAPTMPVRPILVLSATRGGALVGDGFAEFTQAMQTELVQSWPGAEQWRVDASHYIQRARPEVVVEAIRAVVSRARTSAATVFDPAR